MQSCRMRMTWCRRGATVVLTPVPVRRWHLPNATVPVPRYGGDSGSGGGVWVVLRLDLAGVLVGRGWSVLRAEGSLGILTARRCRGVWVWLPWVTIRPRKR